MIWNGALSNGKGSSCVYGRFWDEGKSHYAHRWAAKHIHGLDIDQPGTEVDHCCTLDGRPAPNSLCMEHVQVVTEIINKRLRWSRYWEYWGNEEEEPELKEGEAIADGPAPVPFYEPPEWFRQYGVDQGNEGTDDDCPF